MCFYLNKDHIPNKNQHSPTRMYIRADNDNKWEDYSERCNSSVIYCSLHEGGCVDSRKILPTTGVILLMQIPFYVVPSSREAMA